MLAKLLVISLLVAVLISLGSGLYYLVRDQGRSERTVRALTLRVGISVGLFGLLFLLQALGLLTPHGVQP